MVGMDGVRVGWSPRRVEAVGMDRIVRGRDYIGGAADKVVVWSMIGERRMRNRMGIKVG